MVVVFDQAKADAVKMLDMGVRGILTFCNIECRADWENGVSCARNRGLYGCWQCGADLLQGLILDMPMDDDNLWRKGRQSCNEYS